MIQDQREIMRCLSIVKGAAHGMINDMFTPQEDALIDKCNHPGKRINAIYMDSTATVHSSQRQEFDANMLRHIRANPMTYMLPQDRIADGTLTQLQQLKTERNNQIMVVTQYLNNLFAACQTVTDLKKALPTPLHHRLQIGLIKAGLTDQLTLEDATIERIQNDYQVGYKIFKQLMMKSFIKG